MNHELKCDPIPFAATLANRKKVEIRKTDRPYSVGDTLTLKETVHTGIEMRAGAALAYTGRECVRLVTHIVDGYDLGGGVLIPGSSAIIMSVEPIGGGKPESLTDIAVRAFNVNPPPHYPRPMAPITPPPAPTTDRTAPRICYPKPASFDDYEAWLNMGKSLYAKHNGSDIGKRMWRDWSVRSNKFHESTIDRYWDSFKPPKGD